MGFGASTTVGNVAVDLVQTDVNSIIAGIAGATPKTLADIQDDTSYLYSSSAGYGVADLLYSSNYSSAADLLDNIDYNTYDIYNETSNYLYYLSDIYSDTSNYLYYLDYLYSSSAGYGVADLLYNYLYYSGYSAGNLLYEIEANTSDMTDMQYLYSSSAGKGAADILYDIDSDLGNLDYLYSSSAGYGVADLLQYSGSSAGYLLYNMDSYLSSIYSDTSYLSSIDSYLSSIYWDTSYLSSIQSDTSYLYSSSAGYGVADLLYSSSGSKSVADLLYSSSSNTVADLLESIKTAVESLANTISAGRIQVDDQH